jgi:nucleoside-diphosphate-sugar epimerase
MKAFITGATGYIGHELAMYFAKKGNTVHALIRDPNSQRVPIHPNINIFKGNICDQDSISEAIKGCDYVIHSAAFTDLRCSRIDCYYKTNVQGTRNVLELALKNNIKKFILTSTLSVLGPALYHVPITETQPRLHSFKNAYELTKKMAEELVLEFSGKGLHCSILNISRVYGPGLDTFSNGVNRAVKKIIKNRLLIVPTRLNIEANYVYISDVVRAHYNAIEYAENGENYIIGGENADYNRLFSLTKNITKSDIIIAKIDYKLMKTIINLYSSFCSLFKVPSPITSKILDSLFTHRSASSEKAVFKLRHQITPLKIGLERTIHHLKLQT